MVWFESASTSSFRVESNIEVAVAVMNVDVNTVITACLSYCTSQSTILTAERCLANKPNDAQSRIDKNETLSTSGKRLSYLSIHCENYSRI
jgi:hypothetical protein